MSQDYKAEERIIKDIIYRNVKPVDLEKKKKTTPVHHLLQKHENIKSTNQESTHADKDSFAARQF